MLHPRTAVLVLASAPLVAQDWRPAYPQAEPIARYQSRMVFDAARSELVLFGGASGSMPLGDTWTYDGTTWTQRFPAASPMARTNHAMCYDSVRQRVVLYGGQVGGSPLNDTWEWDGTNWTQMAPAVSPPIRFYPVITYTGTRTLLFGGAWVTGALNDTWVWNGATWAQVNPANAPTARYYHALSGQGAGQALLYGGVHPTLGYFADTWRWTGANWVQETPTTSPATRLEPTLVWDPVNARHLLWSGADASMASLEDTWAFAGGQWTQLSTQRSPAGRRGGGQAAWFAPQQRLIVYSGDYLVPGNLKSTPMWEFGQGLASFVKFGQSVCPYPDPPVLRAHRSQPKLGSTFEARVDSVGAVLTSVAIGSSNTTWSGGALPFDMVAVGTNPNCLLRVSPDLLLYLGFGQSEAWLLPIPNNPALVGYTLYAQGFTWGLGTFPTNISLANAATLVVDID